MHEVFQITPQDTPNQEISVALNKLQQSLKSAPYEKDLREALQTWENADPAIVDRYVKWGAQVRDEFLSLTEAIDNDEDIDMAAAIHYIELKSRWIAMNTKINYQRFRGQDCSQDDAFKASALSMLLAVVEGLIPQEDIENITSFLAEPIRRAA